MSRIEERREKVRRFLRDPANRGKAVRAVAREVEVSQALVYSVAEQIGHEWPDLVEYTRNGVVQTMDAAKIGKKPVEVKILFALQRIAKVLTQRRAIRQLDPIRRAVKEVRDGLKKNAD